MSFTLTRSCQLHCHSKCPTRLHFAWPPLTQLILPLHLHLNSTYCLNVKSASLLRLLLILIFFLFTFPSSSLPPPPPPSPAPPPSRKLLTGRPWMSRDEHTQIIRHLWNFASFHRMNASRARNNICTQLKVFFPSYIACFELLSLRLSLSFSCRTIKRCIFVIQVMEQEASRFLHLLF